MIKMLNVSKDVGFCNKATKIRRLLYILMHFPVTGLSHFQTPRPVSQSAQYLICNGSRRLRHIFCRKSVASLLSYKYNLISRGNPGCIRHIQSKLIHTDASDDRNFPSSYNSLSAV